MNANLIDSNVNCRRAKRLSNLFQRYRQARDEARFLWLRFVPGVSARDLVCWFEAARTSLSPESDPHQSHKTQFRGEGRGEGETLGLNSCEAFSTRDFACWFEASLFVRPPHLSCRTSSPPGEKSLKQPTSLPCFAMQAFHPVQPQAVGSFMGSSTNAPPIIIL